MLSFFMLNNDAVITFADNQKSHQPNDKEGIGQDTIEPGERYEKGYEPNNQVYIEQKIPKPFAVVEQKGCVLFYLDIVARRTDRKIDAFTAFAQWDFTSKLHTHLVMSGGHLYLCFALHGACIQVIDKDEVRQTGFVETTLVAEGKSSH